MDGVNGGTARANERYLLISPSIYRHSLSEDGRSVSPRARFGERLSAVWTGDRLTFPKTPFNRPKSAFFGVMAVRSDYYSLTPSCTIR